MLARFRGWGPTVILSDGDVVFQPRKVERSGLGRAVDGVLIYVHKERELDDVERRYPADHYVLVDDKLRVLTAVKRAWGGRVTTVFPRQGHYAHDPETLAANPAADVTVERIGDLVNHDLSPARARAPRPPRVDRMALSAEQIGLLDAYWRAANYLTVGQIYLRDNPLLREPLDRRARQAAAARPLGHLAGPHLHLRASEPARARGRRGRDLPGRPGSRRARDRRQRLPRGHVLRDLPGHLEGRGRDAAPLPPVLDARAASRAT